MNSKISNRPDQVSNSPLKPTSFPVDLSLFQLSQASSKNKKSASPTEAASIQLSSVKASEAKPNLFQYNERAPLIFSSDEEDNPEPRFNYFPDRDDIRPMGESITPFVVSANEKTDEKSPLIDEFPLHKGLSKDNPAQFSIKELLSPQALIKINEEVSEDNKKSEQIILHKVYVSGKQSKPSKAKIESKISEVIINEKLIPSPSEPIKPQYSPSPIKQDSSMIFSKSEQGLGVQKGSYSSRESLKKQNSQVFSKTDEIIQRVKLHKNEDILIEQQSDQSSSNNYKQSQAKPIYQHDPYITVRDSMESQGNPQKRRRNRIFDGGSIKNKSKQGNTTPEKGVQTQRIMNDSGSRQEMARQYDYYPQIKTLNVLNKIVDQINPTLAKVSRRNVQVQETFFDSLVLSTEELEATIRSFNNITMIEKVEDHILIRARKQAKETIKEARNKIAKFMSIRIDDQLTQSQQRILRKFQQLSSSFEIIEGVIQSFIETKYRLSHLMESTKGFMVNLKRGELKKIYCTLRQMGIQIETLKSIRAGCGELKLQRMFREYLEGEIRPLSELQEEMRERVGNMGPNFKI